MAPIDDADLKADNWILFTAEDDKPIYVNASLARTISASIGGRTLIKFDSIHSVAVQAEPAEVVARLKT